MAGMKVQKLGLKCGKGIVYTVTEKGKILVTRNGETSSVKTVKLKDTKDFLYGIDKDGDLMREFRDMPRPSGPKWPKEHPTQPASVKLDARALVKKVDALLFPLEIEYLAHSGFVDDDDIDRSRKVYEKEFARLAGELSYALGPGEEVETQYGNPAVVWTIRGRKAMLRLGWEDKEFPGSIELVRLSDDEAATLRRTKRPKKKRRA